MDRAVNGGHVFVLLRIRNYDANPKAKRGGYIRSFLLHRFLPVWLQFAICVLLFFVVNCITGKLAEYSCQQIMLSFTGWTAIGNSNWFMFVTFALYLAVYCSFRIFPKKSDTFHLIVLTGFSLALLVILYFSKESYWWNTLLCFPLGMWYSHFQKRIDSFMGVAKRYWATALPLFSVFILLWFINIRVRSLGKGYIVLAMLFALCVVSLTMKVKIGNRVLGFFGKHVFSIYILQRIPMMILQPFISNIYLYFLVCFAVTVGMAVGFDYLFGKGWAAIKRINCAAKQ